MTTGAAARNGERAGGDSRVEFLNVPIFHPRRADWAIGGSVFRRERLERDTGMARIVRSSASNHETRMNPRKLPRAQSTVLRTSPDARWDRAEGIPRNPEATLPGFPVGSAGPFAFRADDELFYTLRFDQDSGAVTFFGLHFLGAIQSLSHSGKSTSTICES